MEWLSERSDWGIEKERCGRWVIFFDHKMRAVSGHGHKKRRRAKKEVRYIESGCHVGPFHGAHKIIQNERKALN